MNQPKTRDGDRMYAMSKFASAVHFMAVSELPMRARVLEAKRYFSPITEDDLPESAWADFRSLRTRTSWAPSKGEGTVAATFDLISDLEVRRLAQLICDIECAITWSLIPPGAH